MGYLMQSYPSKRTVVVYLNYSWGEKRVRAFPEKIIQKKNVKVWLEFFYSVMVIEVDLQAVICEFDSQWQ